MFKLKEATRLFMKSENAAKEVRGMNYTGTGTFDKAAEIPAAFTVSASASVSNGFGTISGSMTTSYMVDKINILWQPTYPTLQFKLLNEHARAPKKAHDGDLGYDLFASKPVRIIPGEQVMVSTGVACSFPPGIGAVLKDRSSMARDRFYIHGGVIDNGYRGEIKVMIENGSNEVKYLNYGDKIAQMLLIPIYHYETEEVDSLDDTTRGEKGFGSTGA